MRKPLTLSIIIPAYNEENHLPACLDSIAKQTVKPDQVIVVDNNSTDKTCEIAQKYDFVTLVHEKTQGLIAARNKGMNMANGDLLARLDADSIIDKVWVERCMGVFSDNEDAVAITGPGKMFIDAHFPRAQSLLWTSLYHFHATAKMGFHVLWGANMAVTRSLWGEIKNDACVDDEAVHEDQDLSILIHAKGHEIVYVKNLIVSTDGKRFMYLPKALEYYARELKTVRRHRSLGNLGPNHRSPRSVLKGYLVSIVLLPFGFMFGLVSLVFTLEKALGLRKA